jgi:hypothetical protein
LVVVLVVVRTEDILPVLPVVMVVQEEAPVDIMIMQVHLMEVQELLVKDLEEEIPQRLIIQAVGVVQVLKEQIQLQEQTVVRVDWLQY